MKLCLLHVLFTVVCDGTDVVYVADPVNDQKEYNRAAEYIRKNPNYASFSEDINKSCIRKDPKPLCVHKN